MLAEDLSAQRGNVKAPVPRCPQRDRQQPGAASCSTKASTVACPAASQPAVNDRDRGRRASSDVTREELRAGSPYVRLSTGRPGDETLGVVSGDATVRLEGPLELVADDPVVRGPAATRAATTRCSSRATATSWFFDWLSSHFETDQGMKSSTTGTTARTARATTSAAGRYRCSRRTSHLTPTPRCVNHRLSAAEVAPINPSPAAMVPEIVSPDRSLLPQWSQCRCRRHRWNPATLSNIRQVFCVAAQPTTLRCDEFH